MEIVGIVKGHMQERQKLVLKLGEVIKHEMKNIVKSYHEDVFYDMLKMLTEIDIDEFFIVLRACGTEISVTGIDLRYMIKNDPAARVYRLSVEKTEMHELTSVEKKELLEMMDMVEVFDADRSSLKIGEILATGKTEIVSKKDQVEYWKQVIHEKFPQKNIDVDTGAVYDTIIVGR